MTAAIALLWLLGGAGFARWAVRDAVEILTAWPSIVGLVLVAALLLFWRPLTDLLDRLVEIEGDGYSWRAKLDPRRRLVLPQRPAAPTAPSERGNVSGGTPEKTSPSSEPSRSEDQGSVAIDEASDTQATQLPSLTMTDIDHAFRATIQRPATWPPQQLDQRFWNTPIATDFLELVLKSVPEMRPVSRQEVLMAKDFLEQNQSANLGFVLTLCANPFMLSFLDSIIASNSKRPPGKALDPISLVTWGGYLLNSGNTPQARAQVAKWAEEAGRLGVL